MFMNRTRIVVEYSYLFNYIYSDISKLEYIKKRIDQGALKDRAPFQPSHTEDWGWRYDRSELFSINAQLSCLQRVCQRILILYKAQYDTYVMGPSDVQLLQMIYMDVFNRLENVMKELYIDENYMYMFLTKRIGKKNFKRLLTGYY